jgi:hypothetical protein
MRKAFASVFGLFGVIACNTASPEPDASQSGRAIAAIRALGERDGAALAQCQRAVDACNERVPDAAGSGVCTRLAERCDALQDRLAELRGPAESCWRAVDACERHAPEQASCPRDLSLCEALDQDASSDRDKTLECEARVQACVEHAESLPEAALVACENRAAACARVAENRANAGRADAGKSSDDDEQDDDDQDDDDDGQAIDGGASDGDEPDDDGAGGQRPRPTHPETPRGGPHAADAGAASDD